MSCGSSSKNANLKILKAFQFFQTYGRLKRKIVLENGDSDSNVIQEVWYNIGCAYHEIGLFDMAIKSYIHAIAGKTNNADTTSEEHLLKYLNKSKEKCDVGKINIERQAALNLYQILVMQNEEGRDVDAAMVVKLRKNFLTF